MCCCQRTGKVWAPLFLYLGRKALEQVEGGGGTPEVHGRREEVGREGALSLVFL